MPRRRLRVRGRRQSTRAPGSPWRPRFPLPRRTTRSRWYCRRARSIQNQCVRYIGTFRVWFAVDAGGPIRGAPRFPVGPAAERGSGTILISSLVTAWLSASLYKKRSALVDMQTHQTLTLLLWLLGAAVTLAVSIFCVMGSNGKISALALIPFVWTVALLAGALQYLPVPQQAVADDAQTHQQ